VVTIQKRGTYTDVGGYPKKTLLPDKYE